MKIKSPSNIELYDIQVDDRSVRYRSIMSDDSLSLHFSTPGTITISVGSYVDFEGQRYTLIYPENFKKHNTRNFEYTLVLHGNRELLKRFKFKDTAAIPYRLKFPLTAKPVDFVTRIVQNMNLHDSGWTVGTCTDATEKLISFNHESCFDVLGRLAQEFNTEWEIAGKTIHLRKVEKFKADPLPLSYGKGNGFKSGTGRMNDGDKIPIGRLYVQGGERNIDFSTYGSASLLLPKSATLEYEGKTYRTDAEGMSITRDGNSNIGEESYDGSDIYPKWVGIVSEVIAVDASKNFYDIKDYTIPYSLNFRDCRIPGEKATIVFQSGILAGREFDIEQTDTDLTGYIHAERRFKIVPQEQDGMVMPGGAFIPAVENKYAVFNIRMPQAYIRNDADKSGASWDMFREAVKYFAQNETQKFQFTGELDGVWSKSRWLQIGGKIVPGGHVLFSDPQFLPGGEVIRIVSVKDYVNSPHKPEITLSNAPVSGSFASGLAKLEAEEVVIEQNRRDMIRFAQRQWRDTKETQAMLEQSLLNFSGSINPLTIKTMQLIAGDESLQFRFVNSKTTPVRVDHDITFNPSTKVLTAAAGIIQHMTLGITEMSSAGRARTYKFWDISSYPSPALTSAEIPYYLYLKCSKTGTSGTYILSETAIGMESVSGFYHFLIGILNSEQGGDRSFAPVYGFTEILPGRITTDRIVSQDGNTFFDLLNGIIGGKISFTAGSSGLANLSEWDAAAQSIQDAQNTANQAAIDAENALQEAMNNVTDYNAKFATIQQQVDGEVNNWFYAYTPTPSNYPASEWTTNEIRDRHIGDTFTNTQAYVDASSTPDSGKSWRYVKNSGVYSWTIIADSDAVKALLEAATAKSTADGKSTTYLIQPSKYSLGDAWVLAADATINGVAYKAGDILTATQSSEVYNAAHWVKKVRYTDDTAANAAQAAASNAQTAANTANSLLADIAADDRLTPSDKQAAQKEWDIILSEKAKIDAHADIYGVSKTAYGTAYVNLSNYITPLLSSLSTTSDIVGTTFRLNFKAYYDARQDLLNAAAEAAKNYSNNLIANLYVGGENMIVGSKRTLTAGENNYKYSVLYGYETGTAAAAMSSIAGDNTLTAQEKTVLKNEWENIQYQKPRIEAIADSRKVSKTTYGAAFANLSGYITPLLADMNSSSSVSASTFNSLFTSYYSARQALLVAAGAYLTNGKTYVLSVGSVVKISGAATKIRALLYDFVNLTAQVVTDDMNVSASRQVYTFTVPATGYYSLIIYAGMSGSTSGNIIAFDQLMLQEGNKASAFTPAVRHVSDALDGSTDIIGGLVATNLLMMKDLDSNIRGGMSGLNDNIGFWTGGTYAEALSMLAKIILRKDGSGHLAGGKIKWNADGSLLEVIGKITANEGKIGNLSVTGGALQSDTITLTEQAVETLPTLLSPVPSSISYQSTWQDNTYNSDAHAITQSIVLQIDSQVRFKATAFPSPNFGGNGIWSVYITDANGATVYSDNGADFITDKLYAVMLPPGSYNIHSVAGGLYELGVNYLNSASITGESSSIIYSVGYISRTKIGNNGFYSFWDALKYVYYSSTEGLKVRGNIELLSPNGQSGIRITNNGVEFNNKNGGWKQLT